MEIWKDIEGYPNYQISNMGNVKSLKFGRERILKPQKNKDGYLMLCLRKQGKQKLHYIHRLAAMAFINNPNNFREINHKDEDKQNNNVENLEFCDRGYNINYGTRTKRSAEKCSKMVLCVETNKIYPSAIEVQRQLGFAQSNISNTCNGKRKTCGGYRWQYVS